eukprot:COSAG01_NODE_775_length_13698_cov_60.191632_2_plen_102_part_00
MSPSKLLTIKPVETSRFSLLKCSKQTSKKSLGALSLNKSEWDELSIFNQQVAYILMFANFAHNNARANIVVAPTTVISLMEALPSTVPWGDFWIRMLERKI